MINKQPIFTAIPIIGTFGGNLILNEGNTTQVSPGETTVIYQDTSTYGTLVRRITVTANGQIGRQINSKRIDLYLLPPGNGKFYLYKSDYMIGLQTTTRPEDTIPTVIFDFPDGLITSPGTEIGLTTTLNGNVSGSQGDFVSVILEGGTYDIPV
jgi:hypothetical protein